MLKALVFDLGNVLVFFDHRIAVRQVAALTAQDPSQVDQFLRQSAEAAAYERGRITTEGFCCAFNERFGIHVDHKELLQAASDIFTPNDPMIAIFEKARARHLTTVLLSNTNEAHFSHLWDRYTFLHHFDALVLSFREEVMKPDQAIFELARRAAHCRAEEALFTDDLAENVAAAEAFGFKGLLYTDPESYAACLF